MSGVPLYGEARGRLCYFCHRSSSPGLTAQLSKIYICQECYHSIRNVKCKKCQCPLIPIVALSGDERFPLWQAVFCFCEPCKKRYYQEHRVELQQQYREWLEIRFPTPSCVYALRDPRDHQIHYIGRTSHLQKRLQQHRAKKQSQSERGIWLQSLRSAGLSFEHEILEECTPGYRVFEQEIRWIAYYLFTYPLTNHEYFTLGGRAINMLRHRHECFICDIYDLVTGSAFKATRRIRRFIAWSNRMPLTLPEQTYDFPRKNPELYN